MKVLALVPSLYDTAPGQRFRIEQWARYLEQDGFHFTFLSFEDQDLHEVIYQRGKYGRKVYLLACACWRRLVEASWVRAYDAVWIHREAAGLGPALVERLVARQGVPVVYDFDDPIWLPYRSPTHGRLSCLKCPQKVAAICRLASIVVVGNRLLARFASQHAKHVYVVPSTVDLDRYRPVRPSTGGEPLTLGWTGSHSTLPFLELIRNPLRSLAATEVFRMLVISHTDRVRLDGVPVEVKAKQWRASTEAEDLQEADIALAPFPDSGWTPWRCHGKILQYMASGIPTVASPVGMVNDYISDGVNGYLAQTDNEWSGKLTTLIREPGLRQKMGAAGREIVEQRYSARVWAARVGDLLKMAKDLGGRA